MKQYNSSLSLSTNTAHYATRQPSAWQSVLHHPLVSRLQRWGQEVISALEGSDEPRVTLCRSAKGETYWKVYDPKHRFTAMFATEQEVRVWLEQRYYR
ncbi:hypothetical protein PN462_09365 [Spirulina sp. CS-785/01]|uniref:hypothetical protein n=1 Tax=Spirulina sp. CS-785/01 TaxID=3021716 RepID=UPI00232FEA4C|nr:hypothetical protein [Spirulina sp. CS-785/01]MDB9313306.1 hypothetical protein [Spirulina sp. CS-785/01]